MDIVTSLGADEEKIILTGSAMGSRFNLLDISMNTPGSASVGKPSALTYQQVRIVICYFNRNILHVFHATSK